MDQKNIGLPWLKIGSEYRQIAKTCEFVELLPKAVYSLKLNPQTEEFYLSKIDDEFSFSSKIYGLETDFINHVMKTFENTDRNLGVLLNGKQGTGKTVCAKIIANMMNLPIILIDTPYEGLSPFIASFNSSAIFFFDEFEKNFGPDTNHMLLSAMDGAYNTCHKKVFLFTTNKLYIDENFLSRPSRIRYKKTFGNLSHDIVKEYCNDHLEDKSRVQEVIDYLDSLTISTIDILKNVVEEINLHKCGIEKFKKFFNVEEAPYSFSLIECRASNLYTMDMFKKDCQIFLENEDDENVNEPTSTRSRLFYDTCRTTISPTQLIEGVNFDGEPIVSSIDEDNCLVTCDHDSGDNKPFTFIKVLNVPTCKPSLFNNPKLVF